ncbi:MAG: alpha-amylase family glycosyl hydrolase [Ferruginibacter sp.]
MSSATRYTRYHQEVIYEVNLRQYTPEGTMAAFQTHLPRLQRMGVTILWFMPIHPIGQQNRKGTLGSYYSIRDYTAVNPELGDANDFRNLIQAAHALGMKVIIDWVANHAAWDHVWTKTHPNFFCLTEHGTFLSPYDWSDVIQFDHQCQAAHDAQHEAMCYWVDQFDIDGFRADLAHLTPLSFWLDARAKTERIKPGLIWLAETEDPAYFQAFDISYAWKWMHTTEAVLRTTHEAQALIDVLVSQQQILPEGALELYFTSNHDENSWNGTEFEKYGIYASGLAALSFVYPSSVPLIYSGQEIPLRHRLAFFDKDQLPWEQGPTLDDFYRRLAVIRAQLGTEATCQFIHLQTGVFSFIRHDSSGSLLFVFNISEDPVQCLIPVDLFPEGYRNRMNDEDILISSEVPVSLNPGDWLIADA